MENPRTGIVILALLAAVSLAGGISGWQLRPPGQSADVSRARAGSEITGAEACLACLPPCPAVEEGRLRFENLEFRIDSAQPGVAPEIERSLDELRSCLPNLQPPAAPGEPVRSVAFR